MSDIAIHLQNVSKTFEIYKRPSDRLKQIIWGKNRTFYEEFQAIRNISLEIYRGETVGIVGRNGAGKSTLLQLISGTLSATSGQVITYGRITALAIGSGFNSEFSGHENVFMNGTILGLTRQEIQTRYEAILEFADIGQFIHRPVKCYSSGMKSRLAFAVAVHVDPDILIIDETLSVGDEAFRRKCFSRLEEMRRSGKTILFVSHSAGQIVGLCDRAILIDDGEKLLDGSPRVVMNHYHKLMSTTADQLADVRKSLLASSLNAVGRPSASEQIDTLINRSTFTKQNRQSQSPESQQYASMNEVTDLFDPHLKPKSTVVHAENGAKIEDVQIFNYQNVPANLLQFGQRYTCRYRVHVKHTMHELHCGIGLKTTNGIQIGGILSNKLFNVPANSTLAVQFDFNAILKPGDYFINAKVLGKEDGKRKTMHHVLDAIMFRIQPISQKQFQGYVDISNGTPGIVNVLESADSSAIR